MKRVTLLLVAGSAIVIIGCCLFFAMYCPKKEVNHCNYEKLTPGMTMDDVANILGAPGEEIPKDRVDRHPGNVLVVKGDRFFIWQSSVTGNRVIVGIKDDVLCDKWYFEPSL